MLQSLLAVLSGSLVGFTLGLFGGAVPSWRRRFCFTWWVWSRMS